MKGLIWLVCLAFLAGTLVAGCGTRQSPKNLPPPKRLRPSRRLGKKSRKRWHRRKSRNSRCRKFRNPNPEQPNLAKPNPWLKNPVVKKNNLSPGQEWNEGSGPLPAPSYHPPEVGGGRDRS